MAIIEVENLTKNYGNVRALNGVSFAVERGEIIGLLGPNGAGKTTTIKILAGYLQPSEGTAMVAGHDVVEAPLAVQASLGYLPENAPLYLDMAVQEYLLMMAELREIPADKQRGLLSQAIYAAGIDGVLTRTIGTLSKGYRQRVGLAQAILHQPEILILDEPTNGLDPNQIVGMRALIKRLAETATVIVSTHILSEVEATCDRAIIIMEGELRANAKLDELTHTSGAVVAVESSVSDVESTLTGTNGIQSVKKLPNANGFAHYRVTGDKDLKLCPLIFDVAREKNWRLAELRPDTRTLEAVFRELGQKGANR
ncbi:MAG: ATP-binding cassette domain-containing protein [Deltaproteobacteria bacterium]|jgi:ABC-2 type transport system ATP-binding protein